MCHPPQLRTPKLQNVRSYNQVTYCLWHKMWKENERMVKKNPFALHKCERTIYDSSFYFAVYGQQFNCLWHFGVIHATVYRMYTHLKFNVKINIRKRIKPNPIIIYHSFPSSNCPHQPDIISKSIYVICAEGVHVQLNSKREKEKKKRMFKRFDDLSI